HYLNYLVVNKSDCWRRPTQPGHQNPSDVIIPRPGVVFTHIRCLHMACFLQRVDLDLQSLQADSTFIDLEKPAAAPQSVIRMKRQYAVRHKIPSAVLAVFLREVETIANAPTAFS